MSKELVNQIFRLKKQRNALILAHNYQRPEVQDIADYVGDSLELCRIASKSKKPVIVFCGVRFMAETASILCPNKTVLLPVPEARCSLADMITADEIQYLKKKYPNFLVMVYINTSAEVKAESDYCCTSANAVKIRKKIGPKSSVIFVPDRNLGDYVRNQTDGETVLWKGFCPVHEMLSASDIITIKHHYPKAKLMAHPECRPEILKLADYVGGTAGMLEFAHQKRSGNSFIIATELGLIHRLKKENPKKRFYPASHYLVCPSMKLITLKDVKNSLENMQYPVRLNRNIRIKATNSLKCYEV